MNYNSSFHKNLLYWYQNADKLLPEFLFKDGGLFYKDSNEQVIGNVEEDRSKYDCKTWISSNSFNLYGGNNNKVGKVWLKDFGFIWDHCLKDHIRIDHYIGYREGFNKYFEGRIFCTTLRLIRITGEYAIDKSELIKRINQTFDEKHRNLFIDLIEMDRSMHHKHLRQFRKFYATQKFMFNVAGEKFNDEWLEND